MCHIFFQVRSSVHYAQLVMLAPTQTQATSSPVLWVRTLLVSRHLVHRVLQGIIAHQLLPTQSTSARGAHTQQATNRHAPSVHLASNVQTLILT